MDSFDVIVCGGGPTGLFAALELRRHGVENILVLDDKDIPENQDRTKSKALTMHPRTMEIMESCGLNSNFTEQAVEYHKFAIYNTSIEKIAEVPFNIPSKYSHTLSLPQYETESIIRQKCEELGINIRWNSQIQSITQDVMNGRISYLNKHTDTEEVVAGKWILACDGGRSTIRHCLNIAFEGFDIHTTMLMASCKVESPIYDQNTITSIFTDQGLVGFLPEPHGRARIVLDYDPETASKFDKEITFDFFMEKLKDRCPKLEISLTDDLWKTTFSVRQRVIKEFRCGRVFFLGDAAHTHSPAGGQGMNTGLQDGHNLAWKLALVVRGLARTSLLDTYHEERKPVAESLIRNTGFQTHIVTSNNAITRVIRPLVMSSLSSVLSLNLVQERMGPAFGMLNISYKSSSLTVESSSSFLNFLSSSKFGPGDRLPDFKLEKVIHNNGAEIEDGTTLLPLVYTGRFTAIVAFSSLSNTQIMELLEHYVQNLRSAGFSREADVLRICVLLPSSVPFSVQQIEHLQTLVETIALDTAEEEVATAFGFGSEGSVSALLRPDGHLALKSTPASSEEIVKHLKQKVFF